MIQPPPPSSVPCTATRTPERVAPPAAPTEDADVPPVSRLRWLLDDVRASLSTLDRHTVTVLLATPVLLTWLEFFGRRSAFEAWFGDQPFGAATEFEAARLGWIWWSLNGLVVFVLIPMLLIRGVLRERLGDWGLRLPATNLGRHVSIGLVLYLLVLPFVVMAARTDTFQTRYPLFHEAGTSPALLMQWWLIYLPAFFYVEFFFRGFMLFGLERRMGAAAILVATVPYCMVHFHKPPAEAFGSIVAGLVLGWVALRTRCIWSGFLVHILVAMTMDLLAILLAAAS